MGQCAINQSLLFRKARNQFNRKKSFQALVLLCFMKLGMKYKLECLKTLTGICYFLAKMVQ